MPDPGTRWTDANMFSEIEKLRRRHDMWRSQALELLDTQNSMLRLMNSLALDGTRVVAEMRDLNPSQRRHLLDLFSLLHISRADHEEIAGEDAAS